MLQKKITLDNSWSYKVTGDCAQNSSIQGDGTKFVNKQMMVIEVSEWLRLEFGFLASSSSNQQSNDRIYINWYEDGKNFERTEQSTPYCSQIIIFNTVRNA